MHDLTFSGDGRLTTDFSAAAGDFGGGVAVQKSDGRIVAVGSSGSRFALARYHGFACNGANVTILGTNGSDLITGTNKPDVIHGLAGNDNIDGTGGNDTVCAAGGGGVLKGGLGNDTLATGLGSYTLNGGDNTDVCLGSNLGIIFDPLDTFIACETVNTGGAGVSGEWLAIEELCNRSPKNLQCRLQGTLRVFNPGTETTAVPTAAALFLSSDEFLDENDWFLTTEEVSALDSGGDTNVRLNLKLPDGIDIAASFIIAVVDFFNDVSERNETNNVAVSPAVVSRSDPQARQ